MLSSYEKSGPEPLLRLKSRYQSPPVAVAWSADGRWVAVAHGGGYPRQVRPALTVFDLNHPRTPYVVCERHPMGQATTPTRGVYDVQFVDGQLLYVETFDSGLGGYEPDHVRYQLWNPPGGPTETLLSWRDSLGLGALHHSLPTRGPVLLTPELPPRLFDLGRREVLATLPPFNERNEQGHPKGWWAADCDLAHAFWFEYPPPYEHERTQGIVYRYHLATRQVVQEYWLPVVDRHGRAVTIQPGHFFATASYCGCTGAVYSGIHLWHKASGEPVAGEYFNNDRGYAQVICISPDESRVAVTAYSHLAVYDLATGARLLSASYDGSVGAVAFSADSARLALQGLGEVLILPVP